MKLYSRPLSPYSARVRAALYVKFLPFEHEVVEMGWSKSASFLEVNPLGRIPVLELASGERLVESSAIVDYLDDAHPTPPMRAADPLTRARQRALALIVEHDVLKPMMDVFIQLDGKKDATAARAKLATGLHHANRLFAEPNMIHDASTPPTIVDAILLPTRHSLASLERFANDAALLEPYPRLRAYADTARSVPALDRVWSEMDEGLAAFMAWRAQQAKPTA